MEIKINGADFRAPKNREAFVKFISGMFGPLGLEPYNPDHDIMCWRVEQGNDWFIQFTPGTDQELVSIHTRYHLAAQENAMFEWLKARYSAERATNVLIGRFSISDSQVDAIAEIQNTIHQSCVAAGWYTDLTTGQPMQRNFGEVIALMHSELSEALEGWRKGLMDDHLPYRKMVEVELADAIIRILDTAGAEGMDVAGAIRDKFAYNQHRADHQLKNRRKANGKKI